MSAACAARMTALFALATACSSPIATSPSTAAPRPLASFSDGAHITDTRLALEPLSPPGDGLVEADFAIDGTRVVTRRESPWGWGEGGVPTRDAGELSYGPHEIRVDVRTKRGESLSSVLHLVYDSPFGAIPSYANDIVPIFRAHCASCHDHALARDLATYERLRAMIPRVRASIRDGRMPSDFAMDAQSVALFTAWCDGYAPP